MCVCEQLELLGLLWCLSSLLLHHRSSPLHPQLMAMRKRKARKKKKRRKAGKGTRKSTAYLAGGQLLHQGLVLGGLDVGNQAAGRKGNKKINKLCKNPWV